MLRDAGSDDRRRLRHLSDSKPHPQMRRLQIGRRTCERNDEDSAQPERPSVVLGISHKKHVLKMRLRSVQRRQERMTSTLLAARIFVQPVCVERKREVFQTHGTLYAPEDHPIFSTVSFLTSNLVSLSLAASGPARSRFQRKAIFMSCRTNVLRRSILFSLSLSCFCEVSAADDIDPGGTQFLGDPA